MFKYIIIISFFFSTIVYECNLYAQKYELTVNISNQPKQQIILGSIKGDKFTPIDSMKTNDGQIQFYIPSNSETGVYRIILGQTTYAKVMNEPPQQIDIIFNEEDIELSTDFKYPEDSLRVIHSIENKIWYDFKRKEVIIQENIGIAEKETDYYQSKEDDANMAKSITEYNTLQRERSNLINKILKEYPSLFATKLIAMYQEPFLDGKLSSAERNQIFKFAYFNNLYFTDESLMNSDVYTKKVFKYLMSYAQRGLTREQQEQEFKNAIDIIVAHTNQNEKVYEFILDYLVNGFEKLRMDNLITYIADKYSGTTCQTDEITTFERKLLQKKMKIGSIVPDFTLNDINGDPVRLHEVLKHKNLILFWASWCPHCNEIIPEILSWQKSAGLNDFEIIAISLDELEKDWKDKVFALGIEGWYNLSSLKKWECSVVLDYNVYATPTMFVIDKDMKIIGKPLTLVELKFDTLK